MKIWYKTALAKQISKWRIHGTLKSNVGYLAGRQETFLNSWRPKMPKAVTLWPWRQVFNSFCFETLVFFFTFCTQKSGGYPPRLPPVSPNPVKLSSSSCKVFKRGKLRFWQHLPLISIYDDYDNPPPPNFDTFFHLLQLGTWEYGRLQY